MREFGGLRSLYIDRLNNQVKRLIEQEASLSRIRSEIWTAF